MKIEGQLIVYKPN